MPPTHGLSADRVRPGDVDGEVAEVGQTFRGEERESWNHQGDEAQGSQNQPDHHEQSQIPSCISVKKPGSDYRSPWHKTGRRRRGEEGESRNHFRATGIRPARINPITTSSRRFIMHLRKETWLRLPEPLAKLVAAANPVIRARTSSPGDPFSAWRAWIAGPRHVHLLSIKIAN